MPSFQVSRQTIASVGDLVPGGVNSHFRLGAPPNPLVFDHADGSRLVDVDGNHYIDYCLGMGPMILGHTPEAVIDAVCRQVRRGVLFAGQSEVEYQAAQLVRNVVPCAESVRFGSSGTEVVQAALRLARAATGRRIVVKFEGHYHGWLDNVFWSVTGGEGGRDAPAAAPESMGQLDDASAGMRILPWNDLELVEKALTGDEVAAVIMEPVMFNTGGIMPDPGYLEGVRETCDRHGTLLVFDEIITGFRVAPGGAQEAFGVTPDLTTLGKAIGNGFPVSALVGRRELMGLLGDGKVVHGGTYNAQAVSMAAVVATLTELADPAVRSRITIAGQKLMQGIRDAFAARGLPAEVVGFPAVFQVRCGQGRPRDYRDLNAGDSETYRRLAGRLLEAGVRALPRGTWFCSSAHTDTDIADTLQVVSDTLETSAWKDQPTAAAGHVPDC